MCFIENGKRAHLFLSLLFQKNKLEEKENDYVTAWIANNDHSCSKDSCVSTDFYFNIWLMNLNKNSSLVC